MSDTRYRFGPLDKGGFLFGLRLPQVLILAAAGVLAVIILTSSPSALGLLVAVLIGGVAALVSFLPVSGRTLDQWIPVLARWFGDGIMGRRRFVSSQPVAGRTLKLEPQPYFPSVMKGVTILSVPMPGSRHGMGVLKDARAGTYTGVLAVRGRSFALLDGPDKARRLATWAGVLAGLAREGGLVHRVQWIERTVPDPGDDVGNYLREQMVLPPTSASVRSYLEVVDEAGPVTQEHEVFVALQINAGTASRAIKNAGGGDEGAAEVLRRELTTLSTRLMGADITVEGVLTPRLVAHALRTAFDPYSRIPLARIASKQAEREGTSVTNAGPIATETTWSRYRTDSAWHATYWISEYPRVDVDPDFLTPLLLKTQHMRTVAVTMEPVNPLKAIRSVESARTASMADEALREKHGFMTTARRRREQEGLVQHEEDLSKGHAFFRFVGFITVSAPTLEELDAACGEVEQAAGQSFLDLRRLNGEQDLAFTFTLPLGRGLG